MRNIDSIVNQILAEAFTDTGAQNAINPDTNMSAKGGVQRQMLAGEMVSSPAYFFQTPTADTHQKLNAVLDGQAKVGLGELVGIGQSVASFLESYLEDTAVDMYTNPNNVEYLINSLRESGYDEYATAVDAITLNPTLDDVTKLNHMVEQLEKDPNNEYFVESLIYIAEKIVEAEDGDTPKADESSASQSASKDITPQQEGGAADRGESEGDTGGETE